MLIKWTVCSLIVTLGFAVNAPAQEPTVKEGIAYRKAKDGKAPDYWKLDLAIPKEGKGPYPVIVCVHGGGWRGGHRKNCESMMKEFAKAGFVSATISYRLTNVAKFPAQIEDCKAAVRFLRAHAKEYKLNPKLIGAVGLSAGGHLVSLMGSADKRAGLEGDGGNADQSSRVQAVVSFFGPTDFVVKRWNKAVEDYFLVPFFGDSYEKVKKAYIKGSPIHYVTKDDPPYLFFHGDKDPLVGLYNSVNMAEALKKVGVSAEVIVMKGEGHGWRGEKQKDSLKRTLKFFGEKLKKTEK